MNRRPSLGRDLLLGLGVALGAFLVDLALAWSDLGTAAHRLRGLGPSQRLVAWSLAGTVLRVGVAHLLLGTLLGGLLALVVRARAASPRRSRAVLLGGVLAWSALAGMVRWPWLWAGVPGRGLLLPHLDPARLDAAAGLLFLGWLLAGTWRAPPGRRHWGMAAGAILLALAIGLLHRHPRAADPPAAEGPNVLLVSLDALRPDHLRSGGHSRDTAPALDAALAEAAVFPDAFTPLARTWPAWMTMLTGEPPHVHGHRTSLPVPGRERPTVPLLTDVLRSAGVTTVFSTDDSRFSAMFPHLGWDRVDQPPPQVANLVLSRHEPRWHLLAPLVGDPLLGRLVPVLRYNQAFGAGWRPAAYAEHLVALLGWAAARAPFFMAVHLCALHAPGERPWPAWRAGNLLERVGPDGLRYAGTGSRVADGAGGRRGDPAHDREVYDAGIAILDATWARLEAALRARGLDRTTTVLFVSDHGEAFEDPAGRVVYRAPNHGFHPWGVGQHRVLLAVRGPGWVPGRRTGLATLADIAPTVAAIFGIPFRPRLGRPLQAPLPPDRRLGGETAESEPAYQAPDHLRPAIPAGLRRYAVDPETRRPYLRPEVVPGIVAAKDRWALDGTFWLVEEPTVGGARRTLYRWREDPDMLQDLSGFDQQVVERLAKALPPR